VTGHCVFGVLSTGKKFTNAFALHFTVTDGKIVRYHMYEDSHAISAAFAA
jgi:ketosteroid isomerase-like protein